MGRVDRRRLLRWAGLGLVVPGAVAGCAAPWPDIAEGERPPVEGGIGGTGIVGVVTGLGSILVGGLRVEIAGDAEIRDAFGPAPRAALKPGTSVTVEAEERPTGLVARRVRIAHPLVGAVDRVSGDGQRIEVLGVAVELEPGVISLAERGDRVAVSGLWNGAGVVASRIDRLAEPGPSAVAGATGGPRPGGAGFPTVGGVPVATRGRALPGPIGYATVTGEARDGILIAERIEPDRFTGAAGPLTRLVVEGYLDPVGEPPGFVVAGLGHSFDAAARLAPLAETRAVFAGPYTGLFEVEAALPLPEDPLRRAGLLGEPAPVSRRPGAIGTR